MEGSAHKNVAPGAADSQTAHELFLAAMVFGLDAVQQGLSLVSECAEGGDDSI